MTEDGDVRYRAVIATSMEGARNPFALPRKSVTKKEVLEACGIVLGEG